MIWKLDKTLGYVYCIDKSSPYSNSQGKVYQHHYVMCESIGRPLDSDECVHHVDRDRSNNNISNLLLLTNSEHMLLHAKEDKGFVSEDRECPTCTSTFTTSVRSRKVHCSAQCADKASRRFEISKEDLEALVWSLPTTKVAAMLGVSDVAVAKRCKKYGVSKPPRGYWAKKAAELLV